MREFATAARACRALAGLVTGVLVLVLTPVPAHAAVSLTTKPLTWGVIGLDSNDVTDGPNLFPVGARVCNTGSTAATGLTSRFVWDSASPYLTVSGVSARSLAPLAAGACRDSYFTIAVTRTAAAYFATRRFHITFSGGGVTRSTPVRELYVEKLVSQNRNNVLGIDGPATMVLGKTYTIVVRSETAPGGYEQVETFLTLPTTIFRVDAVRSTATAGTSPVSQPYFDACTWVADHTSPDYRECAATGKAGGTMTTTYTVTVVGVGSGTSTTLVYDFSGSSYHYNTDYGDDPNLYRWQVVAPDLIVTKTHSGDFIDGRNGSFTLTVRNVGTSATTDPITLVDTLPAGLTFVSATGGGFGCSATGQQVTCTRSTPLAVGASAVVTLTARADVAATSSLTNVVTVSTPNDSDPTNNRDTDTVRVVVPAVVIPPGPTPGITPGQTPGPRPGVGTGTGSAPPAPGAGPTGPDGRPLPTGGPLPQTGAESGQALRLALCVLVAGVLLVELSVPGPRLIPELARRRARRAAASRRCG